MVKKTWLRLFFSTNFSVFGYLMKHSSLCVTCYLQTPYPKVKFGLLFPRENDSILAFGEEIYVGKDKCLS